MPQSIESVQHGYTYVLPGHPFPAPSNRLLFSSAAVPHICPSFSAVSSPPFPLGRWPCSLLHTKNKDLQIQLSWRQHHPEVKNSDLGDRFPDSHIRSPPTMTLGKLSDLSFTFYKMGSTIVSISQGCLDDLKCLDME